MEKLIEILEDIQPDADYENCTTLIDDGILESFAILSIVGNSEDEFRHFDHSGRNHSGKFQFRSGSVGNGTAFTE